MSSSSNSPAAEGTTATTTATTTVDSTHDLRNRYLSNQSIHLLLILSNHFTNDVHRNPYRLALLHFTDTRGKHINSTNDSISNQFFMIYLDSPTYLPDSEPLPWFSVDYGRLFDVLCQTVHTDQSTLLLYMLLHRNQHFKAYAITRTDIDQIVRSIVY